MIGQCQGNAHAKLAPDLPTDEDRRTELSKIVPFLTLFQPTQRHTLTIASTFSRQGGIGPGMGPSPFRVRRNISVVVDHVGVVDIAIGLKRLQDLDNVAIEEIIVVRSIPGRAVVAGAVVTWPEKRVAIKQAVFHGLLQDVMRDPCAQEGVLLPQILIVTSRSNVRSKANDQRHANRQGDHPRDQMECQSSRHGSVVGSGRKSPEFLVCSN